MNGAGFGAWAASIPALQQSLELSPARLSLALLGIALGAIMAMPAAGWLSARFGAARVATLAGFAFVAVLPLPGLAPGLPYLVLSALLIGAANGSLDVSMNAHATAVERAWGGPIMSSFHGGFSLGGLLGAGAGGLLLGHGLGPLGCLGGIALVLGAGMLAVRQGIARGVADAPADAGALTWPSRAALGLGALAFMALLLEGAVADWSGVFLTDVAGASAAEAAGGYVAFSLAMAGVRLFGDPVVRALGGVAMLRLGGGLAAAGMALAVLSGTAWAGAAGFALVGVGAATIVPVLVSAAALSGGAAAVAVASVTTLGYAGFFMGPPLIGAAAEFAGLRWGLMVPLAAALLVALLGGWVVRQKD